MFPSPCSIESLWIDWELCLLLWSTRSQRQPVVDLHLFTYLFSRYFSMPLLNVRHYANHWHTLKVNIKWQEQTLLKCRNLCLIINVVRATNKFRMLWECDMRGSKASLIVCHLNQDLNENLALILWGRRWEASRQKNRICQVPEEESWAFWWMEMWP